MATAGLHDQRACLLGTTVKFDSQQPDSDAGHASLKSDFNEMVQLGGQNVGQMVLGIGGSGVGRDLHL
ncbi:hypothetical protein EV2_021225 [Malus domestica]